MQSEFQKTDFKRKQFKVMGQSLNQLKKNENELSKM